ncbi:hypothetical protein ANHYDRO_01561 [Anaerococcus hydrogenalis DSM 7454]|uniref:Uncharacterized protein n=1 Tax=Anaerococcus hydrogenalis DSM 7454 TaxID=561177 RepID=B6WAD3_9FIRM|nr:hypothetical protein ANHYDRO_01561 [Anaerococcus hydrogenalis DSM 7454]
MRIYYAKVMGEKIRKNYKKLHKKIEKKAQTRGLISYGQI